MSTVFVNATPLLSDIQGFLAVRKYLLAIEAEPQRNNDEFATLFLGKFGLDDLACVRQLLAAGFVTRARHLPWFLPKKNPKKIAKI